MLRGRFPLFPQQLPSGQSCEQYSSPSWPYFLIFTGITSFAIAVFLFVPYKLQILHRVLPQCHSPIRLVERNKTLFISTAFAIFHLTACTYMSWKARRLSQTTSPISALLHVPLSPCPLCLSSHRCHVLVSVLPETELLSTHYVFASEMICIDKNKFVAVLRTKLPLFLLIFF